MSEKFENLSGDFSKCGWEVEREFALDILPHMRSDILRRVAVARWTDRGLPVVRSTYRSLSGLADFAGDMFGYGFSILWNGAA
jgi:hypothetical protein